MAGAQDSCEEKPKSGAEEGPGPKQGAYVGKVCAHRLRANTIGMLTVQWLHGIDKLADWLACNKHHPVKGCAILLNMQCLGGQ